MAKRPFTVTTETYRLNVEQEGILDFIKDIGRKFGLVAKDLGEELENLKKQYASNKEIKNTTPFMAANRTKVFFGKTHLSNNKVELLTNDLSRYLDNIQSLYCLEVFEEICKFGSKQKFDNAKQLFKTLDGIRYKKLDPFSIRFVAFDQSFVDSQIERKSSVISYPVDTVRIKNNDIYSVMIHFNNGDAAMSLYVGEMAIGYDVIFAIRDGSYDKNINNITISKPQTIDAIIKLVDKHKDAYKNMESNLKSSLNKISSIASNYKADSSFVNDAKKAITKAYKDRLEFYYDILLDLITVTKKALNG